MARSVAANSFARLLSDAAFLFFGLISGVITARVLTPSGKGAYAALLSLMTLFGALSSLGLGDASVVLIGQRKADVKRVVSVMLVPVLLASVLGAGLLASLAEWQLASSEGLGKAVSIAALSVPAAAIFYSFVFVANAMERIVETSIIRTGAQFLALLVTVLLVWVLKLHISGAVTAAAAGSVAGAISLIILLRHMGADLRPRWDKELLFQALRLGLVIQLAHVLLALAARVDVLIVYSIAGRAAAGRYSVSLTMGQLVTFTTIAISYALFPRVARMDHDQRLPLVARASRVGLATSIVGMVVLSVIIPILVPLAFGRAYSSSVGPALVLLVGGVLWAEQHLLARARTAAGRTSLQLTSFGTTLLVMVVLDFMLVPEWGIMGAAFASVAGPAAGLALCVLSYRSEVRQEGLGVRDFLPRKPDFVTLMDFVRSLITRRFRGSDVL